MIFSVASKDRLLGILAEIIELIPINFRMILISETLIYLMKR
jgi:hypothetical protein